MLGATFFAAEALGGYTVSFGKAASSVDRCEEAFIARGVTTQQGEDRSYSDPRLELVTPSGEHVSAVQIGFYVDSLKFSAPVDGYYVISVIRSYDEDIRYVLSVR